MSAQVARFARLTRYFPRSRTFATAAVPFLLAGGGAAAAGGPMVEAFGTTTLTALAGALAVGLGAGFAAATLRTRASAAPMQRATVAPVEHVPAPTIPAPTQPAGDLPPCATLDKRTAQRWIDHLAHGPRFGPRIVGLLAAPDCDRARAVARVAALARATDRDVIVVGVDSGGGDLADALDAQLSRASPGTDPFGAGPKVEIVPLSDLLPRRHFSNRAMWRDALDQLGARTDVLLVDLGRGALPRDGWTDLPALVEALDEVVLLRDANSDPGLVAQLCALAHDHGAPVDAQVVLADAV